MTPAETVALYYDAWQNRRGDFSDVPLAENFEFIGPVASFDNAEGYRAMAQEAGQAVTSFAVRPLGQPRRQPTQTMGSGCRAESLPLK
jgi:hypothetical protein